MHFNRAQKAVLIYFLPLTAYWIWLQIVGYRETNWNYFYSVAFSLVPLVGGIVGVVKARLWGRFSSALGRSVTFFSAGLFLWGCASMIWAYYNFIVHEPAPYPSVADVVYIAAFLLWTIGVFYLSKASGARFSLRRSGMKLVALLVALVVVSISYDMLVNVARQGVLVSAGDSLFLSMLNVAYPLFDILMLVGSVLIFGLSISALGGQYKLSVLLWLLGITVNYFADFVFSYTTSSGSFYVADWGDLLFALATSMMTIGVLGFIVGPVHKETRN